MGTGKEEGFRDDYGRVVKAFCKTLEVLWPGRGDCYSIRNQTFVTGRGGPMKGEKVGRGLEGRGGGWLQTLEERRLKGPASCQAVVTSPSQREEKSLGKKRMHRVWTQTSREGSTTRRSEKMLCGKTKMWLSKFRIGGGKEGSALTTSEKRGGGG